jgi:dihydrolipoamide dehydrogenase
MSEAKREIVVIGGGPAGIEAALAAAAAGAAVTVVSDGPVGGRAGWHSLLPSKVWLAAADTAGVVEETAAVGLTARGVARPQTEAILARIKAVKEAWNKDQAQALDAAGVTVVSGRATFSGPSTVAVELAEGGERRAVHGDKVIIAVGSVPIFPKGLKPNGKQILAPRFASHLSPLPESVVVVGAGATGCEFAYLFNRMGIEVTWIVDQFGVLPGFVPEAGTLLKEALVARGVNLVEGEMADHIDTGEEGATVVLSDGSTCSGAVAFVAIGRQPDLDRLNLEAAGLDAPIGVVTDAYGRSHEPDIYVVGDAAGAPMVANGATAQAWVAGRHAAGAPVNPYRPQSTIAAVYTEPQVAQVGRLEGESLTIVQIPFAESLKARLLPEDVGFLQLAYEQDNGHVAGAAAAGPHAADVLAPVAVALQLDATIFDLETLFPAHPTLSELPFVAIRQALRKK